MFINIVIDICVPFYIFFYRDWKAHLIDNGDILSFGVWMHFGLVIALYVLYVVQVQTGLLLIKNQDAVRVSHSGQGKGILVVRGLVILTGILLFDTDVKSG